MRVVTYNIHFGIGIDGQLDLERVALTLEALRPDIVGLQEVDRHFSARSEFEDQPRRLSRRLGMRLAYAPALDLDPPAAGRPRRKFGNAILSRFPIVGRRNVLLPRTANVEQRALLRARVDLGDRLMDAYVTHLEPRDVFQRSLQAAAVATTIARQDGSCVLCADLNTEPNRPEVMALAAVLKDAWAAGRGAGLTFPADTPRRRIDAVLHSPDLVAVEAFVPKSTASDHRPVSVLFSPPAR
jgi:endonuclease/exonuclease/phosphatase family metal-dependent hydrolase